MEHIVSVALDVDTLKQLDDLRRAHQQPRDRQQAHQRRCREEQAQPQEHRAQCLAGAQHALYRALKDHDYPAYAEQILAERRGAAMPPFSFQALLRAEAETQEIAQGFLEAAASSVQNELEFEAWRDPQSAAYVTLYPAIPMPMQRIAGIERAQMLVEATSRAALQRMLTAWQPYLRDLKVPGVLRWALDVDPLAI